MERRRIFFVFFWLLQAGKIADGSREEVRAKREGLIPPPLVAPYGGTFKMLIGFAVPITIPGRVLVYGQNFQFQYALPQNATFFTNYFSSTSKRRRRRSVVDERQIAYELIEQKLQRGEADGEECLLRSICDAAETPLREQGLTGELLHAFLTPDYGGHSRVKGTYMEAKEAGGNGRNCTELYPFCPQGYGLLDLISTVN